MMMWRSPWCAFLFFQSQRPAPPPSPPPSVRKIKMKHQVCLMTSNASYTGFYYVESWGKKRIKTFTIKKLSSGGKLKGGKKNLLQQHFRRRQAAIMMWCHNVHSTLERTDPVFLRQMCYSTLSVFITAASKQNLLGPLFPPLSDLWSKSRRSVLDFPQETLFLQGEDILRHSQDLQTGPRLQLTE